MLRIVFSAFVVANCMVLLAGCSRSNLGTPVSAKIMVDVTEAQASNLTKETQARIKEGMTLEEVNAAVGPLLGNSGSVHDVKENAIYEVGWQDPKSKKAILVKFRGFKVTSTSTVNIP